MADEGKAAEGKGLVVVTGASGGIGAAIAKGFSAQGHPLLLLARRTAPMEEMELPNCMVEAVDVSDLETFKAAVAKGEAKYGPTACLINNAGVMLLGDIKTQDPSEWHSMINVNIFGVLNGMRAVLAGMIERKSGTVMNVSSIAGFKIFDNHAVYCATKFGVHAMTEAIRKECAPHGVRVITLSPGVTDTDLLSHTTDPSIVEGYKEWKAGELKSKPVLPSDVADVAVFAFQAPQNVCLREIVIAPTHQVE